MSSEDFAFLFIALIGFFIGGISSLLGIGGGIFTVPLIYYLGNRAGLNPSVIPHSAVGSSLFIAVILSLSATYRNLRDRRIVVQIILPVALGSVAGAFLGARFAEWIPASWITVSFSLFVLFSGSLGLYKSLHGKGENHPSSGGIPSRRFLAPLSGVSVGIISSLTGLGGGVLLVPLFRRMFRLEMDRSIAASNFCIIITAFSGAMAYAFPAVHQGQELESLTHTGFLLWSFLLPISVGALPGGLVGASLLKRVRIQHLKLAFSLFQLVVGSKMIWKYFL